MKERYLEKSITSECLKYNKMAFVAGPRQTGKTTLAKNLMKSFSTAQYFNWDDREFRKIWGKSLSSWLRKNLKLKSDKDILIVLDEIHKAKYWKRDLKGVFDIFHESLDIIVTGSARLNVYKKGSDSLLGRYFLYRLHPFSLGELSNKTPILPNKLIETASKKSRPSTKNTKILDQLFKFGGFPEPYINAKENFHKVWQRGRVEKVIREDLRDLSRIPELSQIEILVSLLPDTVSNPLSIQSLSEDLEVAYTTVARWIKYLEQLYYSYTIRPYSRKIRRSLKKEAKLYLWDWSEIDSNGPRFENLIANHLLKTVHYWTDLGIENADLSYLRNKEKEEVDFLIRTNKKPLLAVEVKYKDTTVSNSLIKFCKQLNLSTAFQVVYQSGVYERYTKDDLEIIICSAENLLSLLP